MKYNNNKNNIIIGFIISNTKQLKKLIIQTEYTTQLKLTNYGNKYIYPIKTVYIDLQKSVFMIFCEKQTIPYILLFLYGI